MIRRWFGPWPLALAAVAAFVAGTQLLTETGDKALAAAALIAMGAVCLGAWITMLASHDYPGRDVPPDEENDGKP